MKYFIKINKAIVICLNNHNKKLEKIIDYRVFSNPLRFFYFKQYTKSAISPFLSKNSKDIFFRIKISNKYKVHKNFIEMKNPYTLPYILSILTLQKINSINFFGFDGMRDYEDHTIYDLSKKLLNNNGRYLYKNGFNFLKKINYYEKLK